MSATSGRLLELLTDIVWTTHNLAISHIREAAGIGKDEDPKKMYSRWEDLWRQARQLESTLIQQTRAELNLL
ncbi:hypothetical protein [Nocardia sp. NPDC052566]|uniref:hypothetical protein n=1 Tax=Nocardia sp. NPDC052566 TaxID=3364330 RepID=UPI0037CA1C3A